MSRLSRRDFLKTSGAGAAAAGTAAWVPRQAAAQTATTLDYPHKPVALLSELVENQPVTFTYPDAGSPCVLLKTGRPVQGGVGPDGDIVAYSQLCTHMGCPIAYDGEARTFKCGCHFSIFDPEMNGQMVDGQATENLPRVLLAINEDDGSIEAVAIDGLIYGRRSNLL